MRSRKVTALIVGFVLTWSPAVPAMAQDLPVVGFLSGGSPDSFAQLVDAFRAGLSAAGYDEGRNVEIAFRWAEGDYSRLPALAEDLVAQDVAVIVASGGDRPTMAARAVTETTPIVFTGSDAPVRFGLVESLSHPGGNVTGASLFTSDLEIKKLELLHEVVPAARRVAMLVNPNNPAAQGDVETIRAAGRKMSITLELHEAASEAEIESAFLAMGKNLPEALLVGHDPFFNAARARIVTLATGLAVPAVYEHRAFVLAGGLMSYGNVIEENYRIAGDYVGRILSGTRPADLPVRQATTFELLLNLKTAATLGLAFPASVLVRADHVVE